MLRAPWQVKFTVNEILFDNLILKKGEMKEFIPRLLLIMRKTDLLALPLARPVLNLINYNQDFDKLPFHRQLFPYYQAAPGELDANIDTVQWCELRSSEYGLQFQNRQSGR